MCYDIACNIQGRELSDYFPELIFDSQMAMDFGPVDHVMGNVVFPALPVIYRNKEDKKLHCKMMEWGIIRHDAEGEPTVDDRKWMLNIRAERVLGDEKSYWYVIKNKRCLLPVSFGFEHRAIKGWKKKVPYRIRPTDQSIFFLPGLYTRAAVVNKTTGELVERWTFGIMTRAANAKMKNVHNSGPNRHRMPLVLPYKMACDFLQADLSLERYREIIHYEIPSEDLEATPVYTIRSPKPRPDGKPKYEPWDWELLPALGEMNPD